MGAAGLVAAGSWLPGRRLAYGTDDASAAATAWL